MLIKTSGRRVLLVDDDPDFITKAREILADLAEVRVAQDAESALAENLAWRPELIMVDTLFDAYDGFALLDELKRARPGEQVNIICLTQGRGATTQFDRFEGDGVFGMIRREPDDPDLPGQVQEAVRMTDRLEPDAVRIPPMRTDNPSQTTG